MPIGKIGKENSRVETRSVAQSIEVYRLGCARAVSGVTAAMACQPAFSFRLSHFVSQLP